MPRTAAEDAVLTLYIDAAIEMEMAIRERRMANVRHDDFAALAQRLAGTSLFQNHIHWVDSLVTCRVTRALGKNPETLAVTEARATGALGVLAESIQSYADGQMEAYLRIRGAGSGQAEAQRGGLPPMRYAGVWQAERSYSPGDCATRNGVLWHCGLPTNGVPGESPDWQMMHKSMSRATARH
jgi:hypothetical protein